MQLKTAYASMTWVAIFMPDLLPSLVGTRAYFYEQTAENHPSRCPQDITLHIQDIAVISKDDEDLLVQVDIAPTWAGHRYSLFQRHALGDDPEWFAAELSTSADGARPLFTSATGPLTAFHTMDPSDTAKVTEALFLAARPSNLFVPVDADLLRRLSLIATVTVAGETIEVPLTDYPSLVALPPLAGTTSDAYLCYSRTTPDAVLWTRDKKISGIANWANTLDYAPQCPPRPWALDYTELFGLLLGGKPFQDLDAHIQETMGFGQGRAPSQADSGAQWDSPALFFPVAAGSSFRGLLQHIWESPTGSLLLILKPTPTWGNPPTLVLRFLSKPPTFNGEAQITAATDLFEALHLLRPLVALSQFSALHC